MKKFTFYVLPLLFFIAQNLQSQWIVQIDSVSVPHQNNSIFFTNESTGFISMMDGSLYKTTNGGTLWSYDVISTEILTSVFFLNESTGFITATNSKLFKTTDGGNSFSEYIILNPPRSLQNVYFVDHETGWCVGGNGSGTNFVLKSTNGGVNWVNQRTFSEQETPSTVFFVNSDTGFTNCGSNIYITTNGGTDWNISYKGKEYIQHFTFVNNVGYAVGLNGTILKSSDYGFNWSQVNSYSTTKTLMQCYFKDENEGWIVGDTGLILHTSDGGISFDAQYSETDKDLGSVFFVNNTGWCTGSSGLIYNSGIILTIDQHVKLNLKVLFEGLYNSSFNLMMRSDSVTILLRNSTPPYELIDSVTTTIDSVSFESSVTFQNAVPGSYFIVLNNKNGIETWSKFGINFLNNGTIINYDFTSSSSQAYGNNLVSVNGKWCVYSGDVDKNGYINLTDLTNIYNKAASFSSGYEITDLNADNVVNLSDILIAYSNSVKFVSVKRP